MRTISTSEITRNIKEMCMEVNIRLSDDVKKALISSRQKEESVIGSQILGQLEENMDIAYENQIPICQDTGMTVVFLRIGQDIHIQGGLIEDAVNEGIRQGYQEGYLRKSVVGDPLIRENTRDNTPGVIHGGTERIWQRKYEPRLYAETSGWHRRCQESHSGNSRSGRTKRLSSYGDRSRYWRDI